MSKLFLVLDFVGNSRATCLLIYSGIGHNTYSRCSKPLSHFVSGIERLPARSKLPMKPLYFALDIFLSFHYQFENSHGTFLLCSRYILKFQFERYLCFFPRVNRLMLNPVRIRPYRVFPS